MNRILAAAVTLGLAGALGQGCAGNERATAADIVARNAQARGGVEAWRKVQTMAWSGHVESAHAPVPRMPFELDQKRPNRTRLLVYALGERSVRVFDGARGWKLRSAQGRPVVEPYSPAELRSAESAHGLEGPLMDAVARGEAVKVEGVDRIGDRDAYHLSLRPARGGVEDVWVDAETYLEVRHDRTVDGPSGAPRRVSTTYGDYRRVDGLQIPFLITTGGGPGATPDRMQLDSVVLDAPLDDGVFASPTAPRERARPSVAARGP